MRAEDWKTVKELLPEVLPLSAEARQKFFDERDLNADVRAEIESLIGVQAEAADFMSVAAGNFAGDFFAGAPAQNQQIGIYKIIGELGHGGMGAVYLAERADGKFEQKVALKLLKREMNTSALRRRFAQEREILASLEHPNIARLLDAGTTDDQIPYIAMEYVEGLPIDDYCRRHELDLDARLELFRKVCAAVNFAHRNLVVHRDLKPSNILVTSEGAPKLLDFGISKILAGNSSEEIKTATVTKYGVMTPAYASPEQLQGKSVTTATDIYSLGVILYELLSGHRPFEAKEEEFNEIFRAILEEEPIRPSSVVSGQSLTAKGTSENRKQRTSDHGRLTKSLKGDLDNIVLKALRKEPERRYSSAENLSEDIRRHQEGLPVTARPNTFSYRVGKFIKRNQLGALAFLLIILAVLTGVSATLWQARVARLERAKAERRFNDVRKLSNSYLFDIFPEIEDLEGSLKAREKILSTALEYLDNLSKEAEGDTDLQLELATAYEKIGEVQGAVNIPNLGDIKAGLENYRKAQKLRESVYAVNPKDAKNKEALSKNYQVTAQTLMWNIDTAEASEYFEKAIKLRRELVAEKPDSPDLQNRLAVLLSDYAAIPIINVENDKAARLLDESAVIIKEVLKNNPTHFYTLKAYPRVLRAYSRLKSNTGDFEGALKDINQSAELTASLVKQKPEDYSLRRTAWLNDFGVCEVFVAKRDGQKIIESCLKTIDFNAKALEKQPDESFALFDLATTYYSIAQGYRLTNDPNRALEFGQKALEPFLKLNQLSPDINDYLRGVAVAEKEIADSLLMLGKTDEALKNLQDAAEKLEKTVAADKTVTAYQWELAQVYRSLAAAFHKKGEKAKAVENINAASALAQKLKSENMIRKSDFSLLDEMEKEKADFAK